VGRDAWGGCGCVTGSTSTDPVNLSDGDYYTSATDLSLPGAGIPMTFTRTYDAEEAQAEQAAGATNGPLDYGWSDNFAMSLSFDSSSGVATLTEPSGAEITFQQYATGASEPGWCPSDASSSIFCPTAPRFLATLSLNGSTWTYVDQTASPMTYTLTGASIATLTGIADANGDTLTSTPYAPGTGQNACPSGDSCTAWVPGGAAMPDDQLVEAFNSNSRLVEVFGADAQDPQVTFNFGGTGCSFGSGQPLELCGARVTGQAKTTYAYDTTKASPYQYDLVSVSSPSSSTVTNSYDAVGRVESQTITTGSNTEVMDFSYSLPSASCGTAGTSTTTVTDYPNGSGAGNVSTYSFDNCVEVSATNATNDTTVYFRDPITLQALGTLDPNGDATISSLQSYDIQGGSESSSANPTLTTDGAGDTTQYAYTSANLVWCKVDPADYANGVSCPSIEPSFPPTSGTDFGITLTWYDSQNEVVATRDPLGNTTTYAYTSGVSGVPNGLEYCSVDPVDYAAGVTCPAYTDPHVTGTTTETFDAAGSVLTSTDADGNTTTNCYFSESASGQCAYDAPNPGGPEMLYQSTDPDGTVTTYSYQNGDQVTQKVQSFGSYSATTVYGYDADGRQYCVIQPLAYAQGHTTCPSPPSSPPAAGADPWPGKTITIFDADSRPIDVVNPLGGVTQYEYDGEGNNVCTVQPYAYAQGTTCDFSLPLSTPTPGNDSYLGAAIDTYDGDNRLIQETNPLGGITTTSYDAAGNVNETQVESGAPGAPTVTTDTSYDADNRATQVSVDPNGPNPSVTQQAYDPNGNVFCSVSANAVTSGNYQCPTWQPSWITSPPNPTSLYSTTPTASQAENVTTTFYDANGDQLQTSTADSTQVNGSAVEDTSITLYDADGHAYCSVDADNMAARFSGGTSYPYGGVCPAPQTSPPSLGSDPWPGATVTVFDPAGRTLSTTSPVGYTTVDAYDPNGNVTTSTNGAGAVTTNCYYWESSAGSCAANAPAGGGSASMLYSTSRPPSQADPTGEVTTDTYFPGGAIETSTTPAGETATGYDAAGDVTSLTYSGAASGYSAAPNVTNTYYQDRSKEKMVDGSGTTKYAYDDAGDLTSDQFTAAASPGLANRTVQYSYYATQVPETVVYPSYGSTSNPTATYTYDALGNMASVQDWLSNTTTFAHDADGNLTDTVLPNGDQSSVTVNPGDAITGVTLETQGSSPTVLDSFAYTRDANEQVLSETDSGGMNGTQTYTYDAANRLGSVNGTTQTYDGAQDPTTLPGGFIGAYDASGELCWSATASGTSCTSPPSGATTYTYDTLGERTTATPPSGAQPTYAYDQLGRMVGEGTTSGGSYTQSASYVYNGDGLDLGKVTSGGVTTYAWNTTTSAPELLQGSGEDFVYGPNGQPVEEIKNSTNAPSFLTTDQLGSTRVLTGTTGSVVGSYVYDAFGNVTHTGSVSSIIQYAGSLADSSTGFSYLIHRYYDPATGQFPTVDPAVATTGQPYLYAGDDPVNKTDSSGEWANICHGLLWIGWAASPFLCALGSGIATLPGPTLYRFGQAYEDASGLQADAERAETAGFPFGVSVFDRKPSSRTDYSTARTAEVEENFHIAKTGSNPHHYTIVLSNPVTGEVARTFNSLFGRTPPAELSPEFVAGCTSGFGSNTTSISNGLL
jgi:RHS repeat-associated protein